MKEAIVLIAVTICLHTCVTTQSHASEKSDLQYIVELAKSYEIDTKDMDLREICNELAEGDTEENNKRFNEICR